MPLPLWEASQGYVTRALEVAFALGVEGCVGAAESVVPGDSVCGPCESSDRCWSLLRAGTCRVLS